MEITPFFGTAWALFPPIVAIILALLTKEVYSSLFIGILVGALMYSNFNPVGMVEHTITIISSRLGDNGGIIVFLICLGIIVSFATGTSWGTFGILIPITFAIFGYEVTELCVICLSATLAGAVTGDHCSPISETAIMSSTAAQVDFMTHVMTQMPYALFTAAFSLIGFTALGIVQHWIVVPVMMVVLVLVLIGLKSAYKNKPVVVKYVSKNAVEQQ